MKYFLLLLLLELLAPATGWAQREYYNWYFGHLAGITFNTVPAQGLTDGQRDFAAAACISDSSGQFVLASNGFTIWNKYWQSLAVLPGPSVGSSREVVLVRQPGPGQRYYVLRRSFWNSGRISSHQFVLPYVVVDIQAGNGQGAVVRLDSIALPPTTRGVSGFYSLPTNWVPIRHANKRDLWLTSMDIDGRYISYLLNANGLEPPVVSQPLAQRYTMLDGIMRASPDGRTLVSAIYPNDFAPTVAATNALTQVEIAQFNPATGEVTNAYDLPQPFRGRVQSSPSGGIGLSYIHIAGLAFSPDGSRLYADTVGASGVFQYNMLAGTPAAIAASRATVLADSGLGSTVGDLQLGPDGNIYVIQPQVQNIGRIEQANAPAPFCHFIANGPSLPVGYPYDNSTFPATLPDLNLPPVVVTSSGLVSASAATTCAGEPVLFQSSLSPFVTAASYTWDFGDSGAGGANQAAGQAPSHTYTQAGTYAVRLRVTASSGQVFETGQTVQVLPLPHIAWPADTTLCASGQYAFNPGPQPAGTTYHWQDGSTTSAQTITQAGRYQVTVTSPSGCTTQAQITVSFADCPSLLPNIILPAGDNAANAHFTLRGLNASDWDLTLFNRWGREVHRQEHYDNSWAAVGQAAGLYYYFLYNPATGQRLRGWVEVVK